MLAITKASLLATFKSPQATFFSLFFPIVLIAIFGALGGKSGISLNVAVDKDCDTANILYLKLRENPVLNFVKADESELTDRLKKGRLTAILNIQQVGNSPMGPKYNLHIKTSSASQQQIPALRSVLASCIQSYVSTITHNNISFIKISTETLPGREYKMIDFFLPGMIGFSLIGAAVFSVAFLFFSLRDTLVLKRMYASPIKRAYIVLGESLSRVIFQLLTVVVLIGFGTLIYHFTLANGFITFINMMVVSFIALVVFMGFGFFVSGIAKTQSVIPIYANLFMFPQYFLSGTFFPKSSLPDAMQGIIKYLPLTALNDAMRNIAFEGSGLLSCSSEILILLAWGVLIYFIVIKTFRWE